MSTKLDDIIAQFDELSIRLRVLLTLCGVAVIFMVFDIFMFSPNSQNIKNIQQQNKSSKNQMAELVNLQEEFNKKTLSTRSDPKTKQLDRLNNSLSKIHLQLTEHTTSLIHPKDMIAVLKTIISSTKKLQLRSLLKKEAVNLSENKQTNNKENINSEQVRLYRHSVEILLYGDYPSTLDFLQKLESMEQKITFDNLEYAVDNYPKANIKLIISTLSLNSGWIGG